MTGGSPIRGWNFIQSREALTRSSARPRSRLPRPASKWLGDCWLLASANGIKATLVTFDRALYQHARKQGHFAVMPG
jgi:hypothetical protein